MLEAVPTLREAVCLDAEASFATSLARWMPDPNARLEIGPEEPDDLFGIFPTGGTTGAPKGVLLSHKAVETMYANMASHFSYREGSRHLVVAPMTHAAGVASFMHFPRGGCNISIGSTDPATVLDSLSAYRITHIYLPPTLLYGLLAQAEKEKHDFSALVQILIASAPTSLEKLKQACEVFGPVMTECYGQVEAPLTVCLKAPWDYIRADGSIDEKRLQSVGRPGMWNKVAIVDDNGVEVDRGVAGEIAVQGAIVAPGYYKNAEATAERRKNGWHLTGDVGVMDHDGYITIVDRKSDMIITGGFNVFPNEIEQALSTHPAVQDCAVIGVPDEKWGEAVKAFVQLKPGKEVSAAELKALARELVGPVKTPKSIEIVEDLPRSPAGKVLRTELRKLYWANHARGVA